MWYKYIKCGYLTMEKAKYNRLRVDYMQLALMAVSYFILNFDSMILSKRRYIYDLKVVVDERSLLLTALLSLDGKTGFAFDVQSEDVDLELSFSGCYDLACCYVADIAEEYLRRVGEDKKIEVA